MELDKARLPIQVLGPREAGAGSAGRKGRTKEPYISWGGWARGGTGWQARARGAACAASVFVKDRRSGGGGERQGCVQFFLGLDNWTKWTLAIRQCWTMGRVANQTVYQVTGRYLQQVRSQSTCFVFSSLGLRRTSHTTYGKEFQCRPCFGQERRKSEKDTEPMLPQPCL